MKRMKFLSILVLGCILFFLSDSNAEVKSQASCMNYPTNTWYCQQFEEEGGLLCETPVQYADYPNGEGTQTAQYMTIFCCGQWGFIYRAYDDLCAPSGGPCRAQGQQCSSDADCCFSTSLGTCSQITQTCNY